MPDLDVTLAGAVSLRRGDRRLGERAFGARQLRLVTAMLVLERDAPVSMDVLAGQLWPDQPPTQWRVAVRGLVSQFRRRLVDLGLDGDAVVGDQGRYVVSLGSVRVDLEVASADVAAARRAVDDGAIDGATLLAGSARSVLSRPVLSGIESDWLERLRDRVARDHLESLVLLGECRRRLGAPADARRVLAEAIDLDPLREDSWRALMRAEAAAGNVARALAAYEDCRHRLAEDLGVDPAEQTQRLHAELLQAAPAPDVAASPTAEPTRSPTTPVSDLVPYVGLRAFTSDEADRFFGRDAEVQALVGRLARHGIVAVVGPSGVGKSSLVRAGLLPALARGAIPDSDTWVAVVMSPTVEPHKALVTALAEADDAIDERAVAAAVREDADGLHAAAGLVLGNGPPGARLLLVVDQFEEVFTLGSLDRATSFSTLLMAATERLDRRVVVVLTLRADFYDRAAELSGLADLLSHSQFVVPPMDGEQVEAAITGPARRFGVSLEPGLLGRIVADVAGEPGSLPLLQHLLYELWEQRVDRVLTRGAYDDLGGVTGALARRAEDVYGGLERDERAVARRVLLRAVQPDEDGGDTRRPVPEAELYGPGGDDQQVDGVVARLVDARLLTAGHTLPGEGATLELAHEALIDAWPRLRGWVDEARGWLLDHRRLGVAAEDWIRHDRHDDWLLAGIPLDEAHELVLAEARGDVDLHLSPAEHELVQASLEARDLVHAWEAEREHLRRALERRSLRRLQALVAVVVLIAAVAGTLWLRADARAESAGLQALVAEASAAADQDPQLSLLLAVEAHRRWTGLGSPPGFGVEQALHESIAAERVVEFFPDVGELVAVDPAGGLFATAFDSREPDGAMHLYDADTGELVHVLPDHVTGLIVTASFSHDGGRLVSGVGDPTLRIWDPASGELVQELRGPAGTTQLQAGEFSPDGRFVTGRNVDEPTGNGRTLVWEVATGEVVADLPRGDWPERTGVVGPTETTFTPDGSLMAIAPHAHPSMLHVVDTTTWEEAYAVDLGDLAVLDVAFSPDGEWLAVGGEQAQVLEAATGRFHRAIPLQDGRSGTDGLAWFPDSERLVVGTEELQVWSPFAAESPLRPLPVSGGLGARNHVFLRDEGATLFTGALDADGVRVIDVSPGADAEVAWMPAPGPATAAFSPDGGRLAVDGADRRVVFWDTETWQVANTMEASPGSIVDLAWDPTGERLATAGSETAVWDLDDGRPRFAVALDGDVEPDSAPLAWTPDGSHLAVSMNDWAEDAPTEIRVRTPDGNEMAMLARTPGDSIVDLAFDDSGDTLVAARLGGLVPNAPADFGLDVWDWREEQAVLTIDTPPGAVDLDPTGRLAVTSGLDGRGHVWDLSTGDELVTLDGHDEASWAAEWSPFGDVVATGAHDGSVKLWDASSGDVVGELEFPDGEVEQLVFSPDGDVLVAASYTGDVRVWSLDPDELARLATRKLQRALAPDECREYLQLEECPA